MIYGAKKGSKGQRRPNIAKDTTASTNYFQGLYGLSEGEVFGLADGGKSIKLDGTPLINDNGQPNFENVTWEFRTGTIDQEHIKGFSSVENEQSVGVELRHDRPFTRAISNTQLSAVVIRLRWSALREQKDNGDIVGYKIDYAIDVQTDGGAWATVLNTTINDKASQGYQRSHRIDLPSARRGWTVRVRRITPNRDSDLIADTMTVQAITEVIDAKLRYPCTSLLAIKYDAQTFGNIAKVAVRMRGMIVQVPSNYNAQTRTYTGVWDGTFKPAYTNNPAWVFYDLCTATRYGLGERLAGKVDKWSLYALGQYCDELVDDGMGGKEPRFTVNVYIQKAQDAYQVLQSLASVFRAMSYWDGTQIIVDADTPKEPVYTFTNANVVNGAFSYTGTRKRDRHSIAKVAYDDPDNDFKTDYVHVRDEFAIAKYGISIIDINAFGCTSRAQAYRAGAWALQSEQLETETVTFSAGLDGFIPKVGEVINVSDNARAGRANGGRVVSASGRTVTLDRTAGKVGDTFVINSTDGQAKTAKITAIRGVVITLDKAVGAAAGAVWAMTSSDLAPRQFRVMSIKQNDDNTFGIAGLQYEPSKFSASDNGARAIARPVSVIKPQVLDTPSNIVITGHSRVVQGQNVTTLTINWAQVVGAVGYIVQWRKDDNAWQTLPAVASQSIDIDGVYAGNYQARVRAVDAFDNQSLMGLSDITRIDGKQGKPPRLASLTVQGVLFGMNLGWGFASGSDDTNFTEIEVSPDGRSNISTLGTFAYPTNKHEITGLQGNLTQYYRARIVDKLGNVSDWTDWTSGTTSADAAKVLDLISGQINQNHLDRTLREPIAKIDGIKVGGNNLWCDKTTQVGKYLSNGRVLTTSGTDAVSDYIAVDGSTEYTAQIWGIRKAALYVNVNYFDADKRFIKYYLPALDDVANNQAFHTVVKITTPGNAKFVRISARNLRQDARYQLEKGNIPSDYQPCIASIESQLATMPRTLEVEYYLSTSKTVLDGGTWSSQAPQWQAGRYMWSRTKMTLSSGEVQYRPSEQGTCIAGQDGQDGRGIVSITDYYLASVSSSGVHRGTYGWTTSVQQTNAAKPFLWNYEKVTYTSGEPSYTEPVMIGKYGRDGATGRTGAPGATGRAGQDGRGIVSITDYYLASVSSSGVHRGTYGWTTSVQQTNAAKPFLWNYEKVTYTSGEPSYTEPVMIGKYGRDGATGRTGAPGATGRAGQDGRGIVSITAQYYLSSSSTRQTGGAWTDRAPTWQFGKYIWTRTKIVYSDRHTEYTNPIVSSEWEGVNRALNKRLEGLPNKLEVQNINVTVGKVLAIRGLKIEHNGVISGYGLMSELVDGRVTSQFGVNADSFYVGSPRDGKKPFATYTQPTVVNGVRIPAGTYINTAFIANASITSAKIANGAIDNAKIKNGVIDNAKIANGAIDNAKIKNGAITTAKIGTAQVGTLQIAGESIIVPRSIYNAGTRKFTQAGEIELAKATMDAMGGNIIISMGFARLFSVPNGAYTWGSFQPALGSSDFHNFVHRYVDSITSHTIGDVTFHIRRGDLEIAKIVFKPNYTKSDSRATPILLYDQYSMPQIVDSPPLGSHEYTVIMSVHSNRANANNDRNIERQTRITGFSFTMIGARR
ncbi:host specificity protein J [Moraxella bovoculi]|uniref:host specificity protein J n=1 Tax=Moraxella bovoculi TaxID=386891 RepID=UPI0009BAE40E|nr:phage tail protein [Moraxella bovoculi]